MSHTETKEKKESKHAQKKSGKRILYIEDGQAISKVMSNKLEREGYSVLVAADGAEGLQKMQHEKVDLVLLDIMLPTMNGIEILESFNKDSGVNSDVPVVAFTNLGQASDAVQIMKLGAVDYLTKSEVSINEVVEKIKEYIK